VRRHHPNYIEYLGCHPHLQPTKTKIKKLIQIKLKIANIGINSGQYLIHCTIFVNFIIVHNTLGTADIIETSEVQNLHQIPKKNQTNRTPII